MVNAQLWHHRMALRYQPFDMIGNAIMRRYSGLLSPTRMVSALLLVHWLVAISRELLSQHIAVESGFPPYLLYLRNYDKPGFIGDLEAFAASMASILRLSTSVGEKRAVKRLPLLKLMADYASILSKTEVWSRGVLTCCSSHRLASRLDVKPQPNVFDNY